MIIKENVKRAVHSKNPEYIPLMYYGLDDIDKSDIVMIRIVEMSGGADGLVSEWGFEWETKLLDYDFSQIKTPAIQDWSDLRGYRPFDVNRQGRFDIAKEIMNSYPDRYFIADFGLTGFTIANFMRGLENFMVDLYEEPEHVEELLEIIFHQEEELIKVCAKQGFDAIGLADDWGTQQSLIISHDMFVRFFKPRYKHQIELAHSLGMDVFMHSCGYIVDIIGDLVEVGLDILNPGQPSLNGIKKLGDNWGGRICFACPVSYQTTGITGTAEEIDKEIHEYVRYLSDRRGGFFGLVTKGLENLGSTPEIQSTVLDTWQKYCGKVNKLI